MVGVSVQGGHLYVNSYEDQGHDHYSLTPDACSLSSIAFFAGRPQLHNQVLPMHPDLMQSDIACSGLHSRASAQAKVRLCDDLCLR